MDPTFAELLEKDMLIPLVAIVFGCFTGVIAIVSCSIRSVYVSRAREQTKRELAAYVAEGTLDPDKAVAIIEADQPSWQRCSSKS